MTSSSAAEVSVTRQPPSVHFLSSSSSTVLFVSALSGAAAQQDSIAELWGLLLSNRQHAILCGGSQLYVTTAAECRTRELLGPFRSPDRGVTAVNQGFHRFNHEHSVMTSSTCKRPNLLIFLPLGLTSDLLPHLSPPALMTSSPLIHLWRCGKATPPYTNPAHFQPEKRSLTAVSVCVCGQCAESERIVGNLCLYLC